MSTKGPSIPIQDAANLSRGPRAATTRGRDALFVEAGCDRLERHEGPRHRARASGARALADTLWAKGLGQADRIRARGHDAGMTAGQALFAPSRLAAFQAAANIDAIAAAA
jgi:hypothetical protein